jgi:dethiobiotin synthetase
VTRPARLVVVTGSGTEVGKKWVAAHLLEELRSRGYSVSARKPVQSGRPGQTTDAESLGRAAGEAAEQVCPAQFTYAVPLAPPMAARALGRQPPTLDRLADGLDGAWPAVAVDVGVIEGAGGACSPLAIDGDTADLARRIGADVAILVGEPELGIINSARLSRPALHPLPITVHLNRFDPGSELHRLNRAWLAGQDGFDVTTTIGALADAVVGEEPGRVDSGGLAGVPFG